MLSEQVIVDSEDPRRTLLFFYCFYFWLQLGIGPMDEQKFAKAFSSMWIFAYCSSVLHSVVFIVYVEQMSFTF